MGERAGERASEWERIRVFSVFSAAALWIETVWNRRIHLKDIILFPMSLEASEWVSEWGNEWAQLSARAKRAVRSKQMRERFEQMSERTSEWPSILRVDFISFQPSVRRYHCHCRHHRHHYHHRRWHHRTVDWNCMKSTHSIRRHKSLSHELWSEWMSELATEASEWASKWVSGANKRANGGVNDPLLYTSMAYAFYPMCTIAITSCFLLFSLSSFLPFFFLF